MKENVLEAINELKIAYGEGNVSAVPDGEGGAYVIVSNLDLGEKYTPSIVWCGFRITHMYPEGQVYPHYLNPDLKRTDGQNYGSGFQSKIQWNNKETIQVSRTSKNWNPALDTAQLKLEKLIAWIKEQ